MEQSMTLIQLSGFSSLFEVAVGINLVFSVWNTLRENALNSFNIKSVSYQITLQAKLGDKFENSRCSVKFENKTSKYKRNLEFLSTLAKWGGLSISIFLLILLVFLGFNQNIMVSKSVCLYLSALSILPSALFLIIGQLYVFYISWKIESFMEQQADAVADWESVYNSASS
ncbi:hypothetical protein [Photobacterium damselae]|nr:hypothetical protein [Photobacterium damselae]